MGKRLDQLDLGDSGPPSRDELAISRREADQFIMELERMEEEECYGFAYGTIVDIRVSVAQSGRVTEGQRDAIHNIKVGSQRHEDAREGWERHERRTGRRYDGFDGRNK